MRRRWGLGAEEENFNILFHDFSVLTPIAYCLLSTVISQPRSSEASPTGLGAGKNRG